MSNRRQHIAIPLILRNSGEKIPGVIAGKIRTFIVPLRPQPPEDAVCRGISPLNSRVLFTYSGGYLFPMPVYVPEETIYLREEWGIEFSDDGPRYIYRADHPEDRIMHWKAATYMPVEAARVYLTVESIRPCRVSEITQAEAKDAGIGGRGWKRALQERWDRELRRSERGALEFFRNPWVLLISVRLAEQPDGWPTGVTEKALDQWAGFKRYVVRDPAGKIIASGTAGECAEQMQLDSHQRFYSIIKAINQGRNHRYIIETEEEKW